MTNNLKVLLIDDEEAIRIVCKSYLQRIQNIEIVGEATNVDDAFDKINTLKPEVILLDIQLGNRTGFDLLKQFSAPNFQVIFITAYEQFALSAIKAGAIDYLLKPIVFEEFDAAIKKAQKKSTLQGNQLGVVSQNFEQKKIERIILSASDGHHIVWVKDILYLSSSGNYTTFHLASNKKIMISKNLKEYEMILPEDIFLRIHQSYIVNMNQVQQFTKEQNLIITNGAEIIVSTRKKDELIKWMKHQ
jgi:two-component system LytT family response regulator